VPEERQVAEALIDDLDILEIQRAFRATSMVMDEMARSPNPKLMLEMGLVRVATRPPLRSVSELMARLEALQGHASGAGSASGDSASRQPSPKPAPAAQPKAQAEPGEEPSSEAKDESKATSPSQPIMPATKHSGGFHTSSGEVLTPIRRAALQEWEELVGTLERQQPALAAVLEHGVPKVVSPDRIVLSFKDGSFYGRQAESPESIAAIERVAEQRLGARPKIEIRFDAQGESASKTVAAVAAQRKEAQVEAKRKEALNHPRVRDAVDVFPEAAGKLKVHIEAD
ncbi:MAG: hypothetical protein OEV36_05815, partial [Myxococcales bacterium]|nr:hypothetical protein [Myxococcales bacterium]